MKLWKFSFIRDENAFPDEKVYLNVENVVRSKFTAGFDFLDLTDFFQRHIELKIRKLKHEGLYNFLYIELSNQYGIKNYPEGVAVTIPFNIERYKELYPNPNLYPMTYEFNKCFNHVVNINEFNEFIYQTTLDALNYAEQQNVDIPIKFLKNELKLFSENNFIREWYYQKKVFKEHGISARLLCKQNCNEFVIELIVLRKRKEIFKKNIGRAKPDYLAYRMLYGDLKIWKNTLMVIKKHHEHLPIEEQAEHTIYKLDLAKLNSNLIS